jgi:hypothetical protein
MPKSITKCLLLSLCAFAQVQSAYVGISAGFRSGINFVKTKNDLKKVNLYLNFLNNKNAQNSTQKLLSFSSKYQKAYDGATKSDTIQPPSLKQILNQLTQMDTQDKLNQYCDSLYQVTDNGSVKELADDIRNNASDISGGVLYVSSFAKKLSDHIPLENTQIRFWQPGMSLGAKVLFNITPDGMFKIGPTVAMHFGFGNWKWYGSDDVFASTSDKRDNYLSVSNPLGFSAGVLAQISFFRFGVDFAAEKIVLKSEMPTAAKLSKAPSEVDPNESIIPANFEQSQTIVDGFCLGMNFKIGVACDLIPNKLKVYSDIIFNVPISELKPKADSFVGDKGYKLWGTAVEIGLEYGF